MNSCCTHLFEGQENVVSLVFCIIRIKRVHLFESASRPKINIRRTLPTRELARWPTTGAWSGWEMALEAFFGNRTTTLTKSRLSTKSNWALLACQCACLSASAPVLLRGGSHIPYPLFVFIYTCVAASTSTSLSLAAMVSWRASRAGHSSESAQTMNVKLLCARSR